MPNEKIILRQIPIEEIHDLPDIPIVKLADKSYGGLVTSMLLDGVKEPVILRQREDGEYQLVTGYRRHKAAELAKLKELPALVYDMTEKEAQEYHKIANTNPDAPIPGKLIEKADKTPAPEKKEAAAPKKETEKPAESKAEEKKTEMPKEAPVSTKTTEIPKKDAEKAPKAKAEDQKEEKATETSPAAPAVADKEKNPVSPKEPAKKTEKEEKPVGAAAVGPTGTAITKLLGEKLTPPTEKDKKSLPIPGEGEAFSVILHPASIAYNIAFLQPKVQDTVADLIGINVKVNNENTGILKKVAASESLTEQKIRDVLEGRYPPKVVEKPKPVTPPAPTTPAMAPTGIPKSLDVSAPPAASVPPKVPDNVVSFPSGNAVPTQAAASGVPAPSSPSAPVVSPAVPSASPAKLACLWLWCTANRKQAP